MLRKLQTTLFFLFTLSLFSQVGKHFWPEFALVSGIRVDYLSPTLYLSDLLVGGLAVVSLWQIGAPRKFKRYFPLVPLILLLIAELFVARSIPSHVYGVWKLGELVFVSLYVKNHIGQVFKPFVFALAIGSVCSSLLALAQFVHQGSFQSVFYLVGERLYSVSNIGIATMRIGDNLLVRPYAAFPHPNVLAYALIFSSIYLVYLFQIFKNDSGPSDTKALGGRQDRMTSFIYWIAFTVIQIGILVTFSRVLMLLYLCWLGYYLVKKLNVIPDLVGDQDSRLRWNDNKRGRNDKGERLFGQKNVWVLIGASSIGLFSFVYGLLYRDRFFDLITRPRDLLLRVESIQNAFEIIKSHWLIGTGLNNYFYYLVDVQKNFSPVFLQPAHNIFVLVLVQTGILGLVLFVTFLAQTFVRLSNRLKTSNGLDKRFYQATMVVLIITLVSGLFDHFILTVQQGQLFGAVLIGMAWSCSSLRGTKQSHNHEVQ